MNSEVIATPETDQETKDSDKSKSLLAVVIHSFFVIPFIITVFSVLLVFLFLILTHEKQTAYDHLSNIRTGGVSKRWQAAFELSKILSSEDAFPDEVRFRQEMISAFKHSDADDPRIQDYLVLAMGRSKHPDYVPVLMDYYEEASNELRYTLVHALGLLQDKRALPLLHPELTSADDGLRLLVVIALGQIGDTDSIPFLERALSDAVPNIRWDAAIALAKLDVRTAKPQLLQLLDRSYLENFVEVDRKEQNKILKVAIAVSAPMEDSDLFAAIEKLAEKDTNIKVQSAAMAALP